MVVKGANLMKYVWTWGGKFFGYISNGYLFTQNGKCVGILQGTDIYDRHGKYIGELMNDDRLITYTSKKGFYGPAAPNIIGSACTSYADYVGYVMYAGYEDFPGPEEF